MYDGPHRGATDVAPLAKILVHKSHQTSNSSLTIYLMQYVQQYFYNKKWDIRNTRNNEKSDSAKLIRGLQRPLAPRGSNVPFCPFQCWATKRYVGLREVEYKINVGLFFLISIVLFMIMYK